jgi:hypothetical protein
VCEDDTLRLPGCPAREERNVGLEIAMCLLDDRVRQPASNSSSSSVMTAVPVGEGRSVSAIMRSGRATARMPADSAALSNLLTGTNRAPSFASAAKTSVARRSVPDHSTTLEPRPIPRAASAWAIRFDPESSAEKVSVSSPSAAACRPGTARAAFEKTSPIKRSGALWPFLFLLMENSDLRLGERRIAPAQRGGSRCHD